MALRISVGLPLLFSILWALSGVRAPAQDVSQPIVFREVGHNQSIPVRDMPLLPPQAGPKRDDEIPLHIPPHGLSSGGTDTALQTSVTTAVTTAGGVTSFEGIGDGEYGFTVQFAPPDTNMAVGPNHVLQWVNTALAIFDKSGNLLAGPVNDTDFWSGLSGCNGGGDPVAQYDRAADRWVLAELGDTKSPFSECIAVSQTNDPTGAYYRYRFNFSSNLNDYPKLTVWPVSYPNAPQGAYLASYNIFRNGATFNGAQACAYDRSAMLSGSTATGVCFQLGRSWASLLPADLDGATVPPAGEPGFFVNFTSNALNLWKLTPDFVTPSNSTFTSPATMPTAAFSEACSGGSCIPQAGTSQKLDSLGDRLMYRLAYRNFGDHESLVVNHSVTAGSSVGVRWYELRSPNSSPFIYQQGTYAPDSSYRWMGSAAMDQTGNIALGYSVSSSSMNPSIAFTGRNAGDQLGTMAQETTIITGPGSQNGGLDRWGDYSAMRVDPSDDCTFWYTNEYLPANGSFNWHTRIANFKFDSCGSTVSNPDFALGATPASQTVSQGSGTSYTVNVAPLSGFTGDVTLSTNGLPTGVTVGFATNPVTGGSGSSTVTVGTSSTTPAGTYTLTITGTSGSTTHNTSVTLVVNPLGQFSISALPSSQTISRGSSTSYTVTVSSSNSFSSGVSLSASGLPRGTSASFTPNPVTPAANSSTTSSMTVKTTKNTPRGSYTITITGVSGSLSGLAHVSLTVQ